MSEQKSLDDPQDHHWFFVTHKQKKKVYEPVL